MTIFKRVKYLLSCLTTNFVLKSDFGKFGINSRLEYPCHIESPRDVKVDNNVNIRFGLKIINNKGEHVVIKRNTTIAPNVTIVTNNHIPIVGVPIFLLTSSHVNDKSTDIIIEEDCWLGTDVKLLAGSHMGRGCIVGAGSIVTKDIPPYAVVVGCPAQIVAAKFSLEQIMEHEKYLYPEKERFSRSYLKSLFDEFYVGKKIYGKSCDIKDAELRKLEITRVKTKYVMTF